MTKEKLYRKAVDLKPHYFEIHPRLYRALPPNDHHLAILDFADRPVPPKDKGEAEPSILANELIPK